MQEERTDAKPREDDFLRRLLMYGMLLVLGISLGAFVVCTKTRLTVENTINLTMGLVSLGGIVLLCVMMLLDRDEPDRAGRLFLGLLLMVGLGLFTDNMSWILDGLPQYSEFNWLISFLSFLVMPFTGPVFWNYQNALYPDSAREGSLTSLFLNICMIADVLLLLVLALSGLLFEIDAQGSYQSGSAGWIAFIFPVLLVLVCLGDNLEHRMEPVKRTVLLLFLLIPVIASLLSFFFDEYSFVYVFFFFDLLLMYGAVQMDRGIVRARQRSLLAEQERALIEEQSRIMLSQIQPHFLYNTLSAIDYLCGKDVAQARQAIGSFSRYLRMNMDSLGRTAPVPFEEELNHTKTYLSIEELRFHDILTVQYDIGCTDFTLPALTLQPMVENAVKYGIRGRPEGGTVTISTRREGSTVYVTVADDGIGFDPMAKPDGERSHLGIENVRRRLELLCRGSLTIDSRPGEGTIATIRLEETA